MRIALFGATGKTGSRVLEKALAEGHTVRALVRSPEKLGKRSDSLTVITGDMMNADDVGETIRDVDSVVMAAGPTKSSPVDMLEVSARNITGAMKEAGVARLVWLTGAGVVDERDGKAASRTIVRGLMKLFAGKVLAASERAYDIVKGSGLEYTIVRPPMLADEPGGTDLSASYTPPKPIPVGRDDLAEFLLSAAVTGEYVGESPLLSYAGRSK
jgi:putative NADH-flavin reductase